MTMKRGNMTYQLGNVCIDLKCMYVCFISWMYVFILKPACVFDCFESMFVMIDVKACRVMSMPILNLVSMPCRLRLPCRCT